MIKWKEYAFPILLIVTAVIIFTNLGAIPLLDPDEPVYAETPQEMLLYNEYISPRIFGEYWYDKPPLYYWLVTAAFQVFGVNEFAARFPSAVLALACVIVLFKAAGKIFNQRVGLISALVLATSIEFFYLGKAAVTDITLTFCLTVALLCFIRQQYWGFYLFAALATLTKGPIGLFFPVVIAGVYLVISRNLSEIKQMKIGWGFLIFAVVALPWYVAMYQLHGSAFIDTFLGFHNVTRFTAPEHPSGVLWYYYVPVLIIGFFPWIAVLFQAIYRVFSQGVKQFSQLLFLTIWLVTVFLFFSAAQTKLVSYILPMFPPMAILVGWYIDQLWSQHFARRQYGWGIISILLLVLFSVGSFLAIPSLPVIETGVYALVALFSLMLGTMVYALWTKNIPLAFGTNVVGMTLMALIVSGLLFPAAAPYFSVKPTVQAFETVYDGTSPIYVAKFLRPGFAFYSGKYGTELIFSEKSAPDLEKLFVLHKQAYIVLRDIDYKRIPETTRQKLHVKKTINNKVIVTIR